MRFSLSLILLLASALAGQQQGAVPAGAGNPYARAAQLPARIVSFSAEPASIRPGQSVILKWEMENSTGASIDPAVGSVTARGSRQVTPAATTTYTLTVHGAKDQVITRDVMVTVAGTKPVAKAATQTAKREVPRMPDGKSNLSGV